MLKTVLITIKKSSFLRRSFLSFSIRLNNFSYRLIKLFLVKDGEAHPKHRIMNYHQFFVDNISEGDKVLDIGCGNGLVAVDVARKAKKVVGIDIQVKNIEQAKHNNRVDNLVLVQGDATQYDFSKMGIHRFDKIILSNVLEHIEDRIKFLKNLQSLSDTILLRVPMLTRDWLTVYKKEKGYEYRLDPTHYVEYTLDELKNELSRSGWEIDNYSIQFGEFWGIVKKK